MQFKTRKLNWYHILFSHGVVRDPNAVEQTQNSLLTVSKLFIGKELRFLKLTKVTGYEEWLSAMLRDSVTYEETLKKPRSHIAN